MELLLRLDRERPEPLGAQLQRELREAIRSGRLRGGDRLPSSRALARELGVSRGLVLECYDQLTAEGYLSARPGSATRVAARASTRATPATPAAPATERLAVDFRYGVPDLTSFPLRDWLWALGEAGRAAPTADADYGEARGSRRLREVLAAYLRRVRGAAAEPELLVVCSGFAQGINLALAALSRAGAGPGVGRVAVEDPGDRDLDALARRAGLEPVPVPVDDRGVDVGALAATGARAVILTPAHQVPTGMVLAPERRQQLVEWAERTDAYVVEDDYDAEFRYDRQPVGALQGLAPDRVIGLGTVSKSLAPALRLGWVACPPRLVDTVASEKRLADRGTPTLDQLGLARLIESGRFDRHLRRMRAIYIARRAALVASLAEHAPATELTGLAAGFHAVVRLPEPLDEPTVVAGARARGVGLYGMSAYRADGATRPAGLVLGFGNLTEGAIARGIATVADLLAPGDPARSRP
jgi:GntR family transcriptional regulator/MocR family aminotransferase